MSVNFGQKYTKSNQITIILIFFLIADNQYCFLVHMTVGL